MHSAYCIGIYTYRKREPQWQKSEDMTKMVDGSSKYGARCLPSRRSAEAFVEPISMGMRETAELS
jgi:hypothetical protein